MQPAEAKAAVAAKLEQTPQQFRASPAPLGSIHEGLWYVSERDAARMPVDDCVWIVFPDGHVTRGIPVGHPIHPPTPPEELRPRQVALDIVYTPSSYFGVLFAERDTAAYYGQIARVVRDSSTWGEFRHALPADVWEVVFSRRGNEAPDDDEPFPGGQFQFIDGNGWCVGGWPAEDELSWFPDDLIEKYGGSVDYTGPNYDNLYLPKSAADDIAEDLRARGHTVEKTLTGDLADWIDAAGAY